MLLLVAGLRPVKDVLYLADAVDAAWGDGAGLRLVQRRRLCFALPCFAFGVTGTTFKLQCALATC